MSKVHQYRIKPVEFEAIQWIGDNERAIHDFLMPDNAVSEIISSSDILDSSAHPLMVKKGRRGVWGECFIGDYVTKSKTKEIGIMREHELKTYYDKIHEPIDDQEA